MNRIGPLHLVVLALSAVLCLGAMPPAPTATWTGASDGPAWFWEQTAFANSTGKLVMFGGTTGYQHNADAWLFDPAKDAWSVVRAAKGWPATRAVGAMAYDPDRDRIVMFAGRSGSGIPLRDTWAFNPRTATWTALVGNCRRAVCPPARWGHAMVWSSVLHKVVVFGGMKDAYDTALNDVWAFGTSWSQVAVKGVAPAPRFIFGLAEDQATGLIVLYGGGKPGIVSLNDTWLFDPRTSTWTEVASSSLRPPAFGEVAMGWSPSLGAVVMTGGSDANQMLVANPGLWAFSMASRTWVQVSTTGGTPSPRKNGRLTADPVHGTTILSGGEDGPVPPTFNDRTWILR